MLFVHTKLSRVKLVLLFSACFVNRLTSAKSYIIYNSFRSTIHLCNKQRSGSSCLRASLHRLSSINNDFEYVKNITPTAEIDPIASVNSLDMIIPRREINELIKSSLSDIKGLEQLMWHTGVFAFSGFLGSLAAYISCLTLEWLLRFLSVFGMSLASGFIFNALHESVHNTAFRSKSLNRIVMHLAGFLCLRPAQHYHYYHWQHHRHTGDPNLDSELQKSALDMDVSNIFGYILYLSGIPFWFDAVTTTVRHALGADHCKEMYLPTPRARSRVATEARWYLILYGVVAGLGMRWASLGAMLGKYWILPAFLGQPMLRFYLLAEHRGCQSSTNVLENTRSMKTNWFYRKMAWQMPYHMEHHAYPNLPFHQLPKLHELLREAAGGTLTWSQKWHPDGQNGYIDFNRKYVQSIL